MPELDSNNFPLETEAIFLLADQSNDPRYLQALRDINKSYQLLLLNHDIRGLDPTIENWQIRQHLEKLRSDLGVSPKSLDFSMRALKIFESIFTEAQTDYNSDNKDVDSADRQVFQQFLDQLRETQRVLLNNMLRLSNGTTDICELRTCLSNFLDQTRNMVNNFRCDIKKSLT